MLLYYTIVLFLLCKIYVSKAANFAKYEYCSNDYMNVNRILKEITSASSRIQCAAACQNYPDCKGYGYAQNKTCYLLGTSTGNGYCSEKGCPSWENIKIYTVISNELNPNYCTKSTTSTHSMYSREMNSATSPLAQETNSATTDSSSARESTSSTETSLSTTTEDITITEEPLTTTYSSPTVFTESTPSSTSDSTNDYSSARESTAVGSTETSLSSTTEETTGTEEPFATTYSSTTVVTESSPSSTHDSKTLTTEETVPSVTDAHKKDINNHSYECEVGNLLRGIIRELNGKYTPICYPFLEHYFASKKASNYTFNSMKNLYCKNSNMKRLPRRFHAITSMYFYYEKGIWTKTYISCREIKKEYVFDNFGNVLSQDYHNVCDRNSVPFEVSFHNIKSLQARVKCAILKPQ